MSSSQTVETYQSDFSKLLGKRPREEKKKKKKSSRLCGVKECLTRANYNTPGEKNGLYCTVHKKDGMVNVVSKTCISEGCLTRASFNIPGEKKGLYCSVHKKNGMMDVVSKTCISEGCLTQASFNIPGEKNRLYCSVHKKDEMVNVKSPKCISEGCMTIASYNTPGEKKGLYCTVHKKDEMVDVVTKKCISEGCMTIANFNIPGEKNRLYCKAHAKDGMIDVKSTKCISDGCMTQAVFNIPGEKKGLYCSVHKKNGMVDVKHKTCISEGCMTQASFNTPGEKKGLYCTVHKKDGMVDVINKKCKFPLCDTIVLNKKYEGFCLVHAIGNNLQVARNYKTKENAVFSFVKDQFPDKTWIQDKRIEDGCSSYRPDIRLDLGFCVLIIEVDEQCHSSYNCECESKRLYEISQDLGHRPIHLLRFNPDEYTRESDGIKVKSCWSSDKKGVLRVSKNKKKEWQERLETLKVRIEECFDEENVPTTKLVFSEHFEINLKMQELFFC